MGQDLFVKSQVFHKGHQNSKLPLVKLYQRARKWTKLTLQWQSIWSAGVFKEEKSEEYKFSVRASGTKLTD